MRSMPAGKIAEMRKTCGLIAFICTVGWSQAPAPPQPAAVNRKVPAKVDRALRERITGFYQAHVEGKFRVAEQYVADDSKDVYYAAQKPRYLKFELKKITYSDDLKKATVVVQVDMEIRHHTMGAMVLPAPQESFWKLEKGQWCWYVDQSMVRNPMGSFQRHPGAAPAAQQPAGPGLAARSRPNSEEVLNRVTNAVHADRSEVRVNPAGAPAVVVISNSLPGAVTLKADIQPETPGLEAQFSRAQLGPHESTRLSFRYQATGGNPPRAAVANIVVDPTGQTIPIKIAFDAAPAAQPNPAQPQQRVYALPPGAPPPAAPAQFPPDLLKPKAEPPRILSVEPDRTSAGVSSEITLIIRGANFKEGARVFFDARPLTAKFQDSGRISATVPAQWVSSPRKVQVRVQNPDGTASESAGFEVAPR